MGKLSDLNILANGFMLQKKELIERTNELEALKESTSTLVNSRCDFITCSEYERELAILRPQSDKLIETEKTLKLREKEVTRLKSDIRKLNKELKAFKFKV